MDKSNQLIISKNPKAVLSQELVSKINVSTTDIYHVGHKVKKYKTKLEESSNKMESFILSNTEKERQAVMEAMNTLKSKVDCLKTDKQYKTLEEEMKYLENKLNITMENVYKQYSRAVKKICDAYPDKKERSIKMEEFHEVLGDAFLTRDERKIMALIKDKIREIPHNMVEIPMIIN